MTEAEWLTTSDIRAMLDHLAAANPRKLRQFACACWQSRYGPTQKNEAGVVEVYRRYLDGEATPTEWFEAYSGAGGVRLNGSIQDLIAPEPPEAARRMAGVSHGIRLIGGLRIAGPVDRPEEAALIREMFGNPFRPAVFNPEWRTETAVLLAQGIYDDQAFDRLPVLADALQDAGCDNDDVLTHCRDEKAAHVRGCWVVDMVLGKA
jgi:hypothetical protein